MLGRYIDQRSVMNERRIIFDLAIDESAEA
jgi:hypothetical protein